MSLSESTVAILAASAMPLTAVVGDQIDILPVTAGITGSFVAGFRPAGYAGDLAVSRGKWLGACIAGACFSVFCAPFIHTDILGMTTVRSAILVHFLVGLLGAFIVDAILSNPAKLLAMFGGRVPLELPKPPDQTNEPPTAK